MNQLQHEQRGYLVGLHSLRFVAFLFIFIFHASGLSILNGIRLKFFFLLSGFILVNAVLTDQSRGSASRTAGSFLLKRFARIGPVYYLVVSFSFFLLPFLANYFLRTTPSLPERPWNYFLLLSNYDDSDHIYLLKFLWAISVEWQLYLFFAGVAWLTGFRSHLMAIIGFLMYGIFFWMDQAGIRKLDYFGAELYLLYFSAGMLLRYWVGILSNEKLLQWFGIAFVGLILLIYTPYASRFISAKGFQVILLTSAVISFIYARQAALCQFISERSLGERLGRISYGLYAYSGLILTLFRFLFGGDLGVVPILLSLLALILVAGCSYRYFEKPVYLYVKSKIDRRS